MEWDSTNLFLVILEFNFIFDRRVGSQGGGGNSRFADDFAGSSVNATS
jgi:hypothetical protein